MKIQRFLLFVSLLLAGFSSFAQPYQPVAIENAHWFMFAFPDGIISDHHAFAVRGDTLINSMAYKKLYYQDFAPAPVYLLEEEYLWGVVRDDSLNRRVYVIAFEPYVYGYQCPVGEEQLLFDFSILPGDTTAHCLWYENHPWILDSTYISYKYGADRRTIYSEEYWWIFGEIYEGIGSEEGLLGTLSYGEQPSEDYFFLVKYCIGSDEDCGIVSGVSAAPDPGVAITVFPNPAEDIFYLRTEREILFDAQIAVYDLVGRQVYGGTFSAAENGISVRDWKSGVYFLEIRDGKTWHSLRFIVV